MQFVDEVVLEVRAGNGGNGCVAFRREKYLPLGGPSGGDGGKGGDVVLHAHERLTTLLDLHYRRKLKAEAGERGRGKDQYGAAGKDVVQQVPVGTQVYDDDTDELIADLDEPEMRIVVARGGDGGQGNIRFATPYDRAPRRATDGGPGEVRRLRLELKLLADVGLVGFPNVGKSTLIAAVSRAKPKIADYPFTTLTPNLGVASFPDGEGFVIADIPGIIEGAAEGAGLGLRFLRHAERSRVLLHVLSVDPDPERDPVGDYDKLMEELSAFSPELARRPMMVGLSKLDLPDVQDTTDEVRRALAERGVDTVHAFSAVTREGLDDLMIGIRRFLMAHPRGDAPPEPELPSAEDRPHGDAKGFLEKP